MPIIGFGFEKVYIEKKQNFSREDQIKNKIVITNLEETKIKTSDKEETPALAIKFDFSLDYGKAGDLELKGYILFYDSEEKVKELATVWKKEQKLPAQISTQIFNFILNKSNLQALQLESEVGLPLHLKMPRFKIQTQEQAKK